MSFDVEKYRRDFPILDQKVHGKPLVYFDNAATTQKPQMVLDALMGYYTQLNSNIHRGVHQLSERATEAFEASRRKVQQLLGARSAKEIVFVRGTTEAINLVAQTFGRSRVRAGDEVLISGLEHHSNIVPWQMLCEEKEARLRIIPVLDDGTLDLVAYQQLLNSRTRLVAFSHISNALGTINPAKAMTATAHLRGVPVLLDGAQSIAHLGVDVQDLDCDFYAFSSHKLYGPTGVGVLYGKEKWLEQMPPYQGGGDMIRSVTFEKTTYNELPYKFEAGTPDIAGAIGLGAAIDYVLAIGLESLAEYENKLESYASQRLGEFPRLRRIGTAESRSAILSFVIDGIHPHDIGTVLDREGIAIRTGHHCAQPLMERFQVPATARASLAFYNTSQEIDQLVVGLQKVIKVLG